MEYNLNIYSAYGIPTNNITFSVQLQDFKQDILHLYYVKTPIFILISSISLEYRLTVFHTI